MTFDEWWNGLQHRRLGLSAKNAARLAWAEKPPVERNTGTLARKPAQILTDEEILRLRDYFAKGVPVLPMEGVELCNMALRASPSDTEER